MESSGCHQEIGKQTKEANEKNGNRNRKRKNGQEK